MTYVTSGRVTISDMKCDECGATLKSSTLGNDVPSPEDGLTIDFNGGYGMYFDQMNALPSMLLCKDHCDILTQHFPNMMRRVQGLAWS